MISPFLTRSIGKPKKAIASDPQRSRFYKMEREFIGSSIYHHVSRANLETVTRHVCAYYKICAPKLIIYNDPKDRKFGECYLYETEGEPDHDHTVRLNRGFHGANVVTLMHELAHYITDKSWTGHYDHGPEFMGVYAHLLSKYRIMPGDCFRLLALRYGVQVGMRFRPSNVGT